MDNNNQHVSLADFYFGVGEHLDQDIKLDLIAKLSLSIKQDATQHDTTLLSLFGAYKSDETAEEIISGIRGSKVFNRIIEAL